MSERAAESPGPEPSSGEDVTLGIMDHLSTLLAKEETDTPI